MNHKPTNEPSGRILAELARQDGRGVAYRNVMVKPLPTNEKAAWTEILREEPQLRQKISGL